MSSTDTHTKYRAGDEVRVTSGPYEGHVGTVLKGMDGERTFLVSREGGHTHSSHVPAWWFGETQLAKVESKKSSQEVTLDELQVGDLIVAFWDVNGVETRRKGVVASFDNDGDAITVDDEFITYDSDHGPAQHIYLLERPTPPAEPEEPLAEWEKEVLDPDYIADGTYYVTSAGIRDVGFHWEVTVTEGKAVWITSDLGVPAHADYSTLLEAKRGKIGLTFHTTHPCPPAKGFDTLDKSKEYVLKVKDGLTASEWHLAYIDGSWKYGGKGDIRTEALTLEDWFTEGNNTWEKPVEFIPEPEYGDGVYEYTVGNSTYRTEIKDDSYRIQGVKLDVWSAWISNDIGWERDYLKAKKAVRVSDNLEPTWQERLAEAGHSTEDRWVHRDDNYTHRINAETGGWEFYGTLSEAWLYHGTIDQFLNRNSSEKYVKVAR